MIFNLTANSYLFSNANLVDVSLVTSATATADRTTCHCNRKVGLYMKTAGLKKILVCWDFIFHAFLSDTVISLVVQLQLRGTPRLAVNRNFEC